MSLSKSQRRNFGRVSAQSIGSPSQVVLSHHLIKPIMTSFRLSDVDLNDKPFTNINNLNKSVEVIEKITGIDSNSPEIIALSNFMPVYDERGNLNEFGEFLTKKQDSILIRASSNISNVLSSPEVSLQNLVNVTNSNASTVIKFCEDSSRGIQDLLVHFSKIKRKMDFRVPLDKEILKIIGSIPPDVVLNDNDSTNFFSNNNLLSIEQILFTTNDRIKHWTPTKIWIQSCLELKELLSNGMANSFLSDSNLTGVDPTNYSYFDPFTLTSARNSFVKKFGFNKIQPSTLSLVGLIVGDKREFTAIQTSISTLFSTADSSIFNEKIYTDSSNLDESIAKLSYVLCKEYVYSTKMRNDVLKDYGYPFILNGKNTSIWNYLIGEAGSDITDISPTPLGGGKSLISLASSKEPDGAEVLSYEDRYINDNIGTKRPEVIIVPGTLYYLEDSLRIGDAGLNVTRINRYLTKLGSAVNMLKMLREDLGFLFISPYSTTKNKVLNKQEPGALKFQQDIANLDFSFGKGDPKKEKIKNALSNPIGLIRYIEQNIFNSSGLLRRSTGPKLWTNINYFDIANDVSPLLISLALDTDDPELQALLFLHQIYIHSSTFQIANLDFSFGKARSDVKTPVVKEEIVDRILDRIKILLETDIVSSESKDVFSITMSTIKQALMSGPSDKSYGLKILHNIGRLLYEFDGNFNIENKQFRTGGKFFVERPTRATNASNVNENFVDSISSYSGIEKTAYIVSLFKLSCLLVHAANPERFTSIINPVGKNRSSPSINIKKIRNPIVGNLLKNQKIRLDSTLADIGAHLLKNNLNVVKPIKIQPFDNKIVSSLNPLSVSKKNNNSSKNNNYLFILHYDDVIVKTENMLFDYMVKLNNYVDTFYGFVYSLNVEFLKLKNNLGIGGYDAYGRNLLEFSRLIADNRIVNTLLTEQQLMLMKSRMADYSERLSSNSYISPIRESMPYFSSVSNKDNVENFLPIEDVHLAPWNLFLKDFLKSGPFYDGDGSNKKIISVGIPQKLHRRMRVNASRLSGLIDRNNLIKLCVYRVNAFLPDIIYKPLVYDFDLSLFPTRILSNYKKCGFSVSRNTNLRINKNLINFENICLNNNNIESSTDPYSFFTLSSDFVADYIPQLKSDSNYNFTLIQPNNKSTIKQQNYSFLSDQQFNKLYKNHSVSFLLEEYLRLVTDVPLDETKYINYDVINKKKLSKFTKFATEYMNVDRAMNSTFDNFFNSENLLSQNSSIIRTLIMPKKFDRVFHMIFDPDDFQLDPQTPQKVIEKYVGKNGNIKNLSKNEKDEPTFDKYYVVIKSAEGSDAL